MLGEVATIVMGIPNRVPWINVCVGILAIISPFVAGPTTNGARWDLVVTGIVIAAAALVEMSVYGKTDKMNYWPVVNVLAGLWLFISTSFVRGDTGMVWSNIVLGVAAIVTALVALSYEQIAHSSPHNAQRA